MDYGPTVRWTHRSPCIQHSTIKSIKISGFVTLNIYLSISICAHLIKSLSLTHTLRHSQLPIDCVYIILFDTREIYTNIIIDKRVVVMQLFTCFGLLKQKFRVLFPFIRGITISWKWMEIMSMTNDQCSIDFGFFLLS